MRLLFVVAATIATLMAFSEAASQPADETGNEAVDSSLSGHIDVMSEAQYIKSMSAHSRSKRGLACNLLCRGRGSCRLSSDPDNFSITCGGRGWVCVCT